MGWWGGVLVFVFALVVDTVFVRSLQSFHLVFLCPIPLLIPCCLYLSDPFNQSILSFVQFGSFNLFPQAAPAAATAPMRRLCAATYPGPCHSLLGKKGGTTKANQTRDPSKTTLWVRKGEPRKQIKERGNHGCFVLSRVEWRSARSPWCQMMTTATVTSIELC